MVGVSFGECCCGFGFSVFGFFDCVFCGCCCEDCWVLSVGCLVGCVLLGLVMVLSFLEDNGREFGRDVEMSSLVSVNGCL